ncbi:MAG: ABC transporter ATP-binding protein, partial [Bacteroidota bacterium]
STFRKVVAGTLDEDQLVVISTHQVKDVENLIDRILLIENGRIILQKDLFDLSSKLAFSFSNSGEGEEVLYSEMVPGGYKVITPQYNDHSSVDIELLFNAITSGNQKFMDYVNQ